MDNSSFCQPFISGLLLDLHISWFSRSSLETHSCFVQLVISSYVMSNIRFIISVSHFKITSRQAGLKLGNGWMRLHWRTCKKRVRNDPTVAGYPPKLIRSYCYGNCWQPAVTVVMGTTWQSPKEKKIERERERAEEGVGAGRRGRRERERDLRKMKTKEATWQ